MSGKAIFFDRDNTLIVASDYLGDASKVVLTPGAGKAVARARAMGYRAVVISNQSGVARGMFTEEDVSAVNRRMSTLLMLDHPDARIDRHEFCPFHPDAVVEKYRQDSPLRKPNPGMILRVAEDMNLDLSESWVIGDAPRDIEAGRKAGCRTILLKPSNVRPSPAAAQQLDIAPDATAETLEEAMDFVERSSGDKMSDSLKPVAGTDHAPPTNMPSSQNGDSSAGAAPAGNVHELARGSASASLNRIERILERIAREMGRSRQEHATDFSVTRLLAGILQVVALATMFLAYLNRGEASLVAILLTAIFFQLLTLTLILMNRTSA